MRRLPNPLDPLAPEGDLPQFSPPSGPIPGDLPMVTPARDSIQPQFFAFPVGSVVVGRQVRQEIDKRARHLIVINDGAVVGVSTPLLIAWGSPATPGSGGNVRVNEMLAFDDLFLVNTVLWFDVGLDALGNPLGTANVRMWYW